MSVSGEIYVFVGVAQMRLTTIEAMSLSEAWYLCIREIMDGSYEYTVDRGSFVGRKRRELDFITLRVECPGIRPLVPDVPIGVPPPTDMEFIEKYLLYMMDETRWSSEESYTYGEDIAPQLPFVVSMYAEEGFETNQACMAVGDRHSIRLEHPQCLRLIDTRVRHGKLHFIVYFRSWDLWGGFPTNLAALQLMKEHMADVIGVADGELLACSKGLHLYEHQWDVANMVLRR